MDKIKYVFIIVCFALLIPQALFSDSSFRDLNCDILSARIKALGGPHIAQAEGLNVLFSNPAGFNNVEAEFSITEFSIGLSGHVFDAAHILTQLSESNVSLTEMKIREGLFHHLYTSAHIVGPLYFGFVGKGLGFGLFNDSGVRIQSKASTRYEFELYENVLLSGGYSFRIPLPEYWKSHLDIGIQFKTFLQGIVSFEKTIYEIGGFLASDKVGNDPNAKSILFAFFKQEAFSQPFSIVSGIGIDAGIRYEFNDMFALGISGKDIYSPTSEYQYKNIKSFQEQGEKAIEEEIENKRLPFTLAAGLLFHPELGAFERYFGEMEFYLDYTDILDGVLYPPKGKNELLKFKMGASLTLLDILQLRIGFAEGLLAAGVGLDLHYVTINVATYGTELSLEPGLRPIYNVLLSLEFRI